ncbi:MAG: hypothetical protein PVH29_01565 [Candidatus Zixiibacteriota bacterium]
MRVRRRRVGRPHLSLPEVARTYPKVQVLTVADYFDGLRPDLPDTSETLKKAPQIKREKGKNSSCRCKNRRGGQNATTHIERRFS